MRNIFLVLMLCMLTACGSSQQATQSPAAVQLEQVSSCTIPATNVPAYAVGVWITGKSDDLIEFDSRDYGACKFYPEYQAWHVGVITVSAPFNGRRLFTITPGEHHAFSLEAWNWDYQPIQF